MSEIKTHARAVADVIDGSVVASVEVARTPERVFLALASREIVEWWINSGVFDTREWTREVASADVARFRSCERRTLYPGGRIP